MGWASSSSLEGNRKCSSPAGTINFAEYTSFCGGEEYTSISCVVPELMELKIHLEKVN